MTLPVAFPRDQQPSDRLPAPGDRSQLQRIDEALFRQASHRISTGLAKGGRSCTRSSFPHVRRRHAVSQTFRRRVPASLAERDSDRLVDPALDRPHKRRDGRFVFVCPRCGESVTAIKRETNLGRCFHCQTNFNPIDFLMIAREIEFVEAVGYLLPLLPL